MSETLEFQAEAKQLLQLMIHSLYSHKEIFLREIVSNASDALDKARFESLTNNAVKIDIDSLKITISVDKENRRLTISDNGIGMSREELINNLGTIARSGSKVFLENLSGDQKLDSNLIGQFGVGFYSVFMVSSKVEVLTKRIGEENAFRWISSADTTYEISTAARAESGTDVIIYLNEGEEEYLENWKIKNLIKKYSSFIAFPVMMASDDENKKGELEKINSLKPIWERNASEVKDEEYEEFYTQACGGFGKVLKTIHTKAEGAMEYSAIAFIPEKISPFEIYNQERKHGVKLYVRKVFISDDIKELLPDYFRFVRGIVDSNDLPLNVSREILQDNPIIGKIRKALSGKIFSELKKLAQNDKEKYSAFWKEFGAIIKEGLYNDYENREELLDILRFNSSGGDNADYLTSLDEYISRMNEKQKDIYYLIGDTYETVRKSPHMELFREKNIEVIYFTDPIDEFIVPALFNAKGKELKSIADSKLDLGELDGEDKTAKEESEKKLKKFIGRVKNILNEKVANVSITTRLKESPARVVAGEGEVGGHMEKMMKAMGKMIPDSKKNLEINANHSVIDKLNSLYEKDPKSDDLQEWVTLLYEQALIADGSPVPDQSAYMQRINKLFEKAIG
ncbi:MAG: molecular chaperone HtpG [Chitinispirillales bacterium]|jgi:molecular chaperone HtpG|nr:molecular chaperone HtpG [Chitinispirillales bacterium]